MKRDGWTNNLLLWYEENRRRLPWREDPTPYHVFLSEIMLQQTRVDTVIAYYERFLSRFPTLESLSQAKEEEVLRLWQGLGYYSRAKNLLSAAKMAQNEFGGILPQDEEKLRRLPGVGEYVSHAIASIAFDQKAVAVDGNLLRVYARLNALPIRVDEPKAKRDCEAYYLAYIDSPSRFNQALMDLGELVCLPHGAPKCGLCPLRDCCKAHRQGNPLDYPLPKKKNEAKKVRLAVVLTLEGDAIAVRKRPDEGLLASMNEFPNLEGTLTQEELARAYPSLFQWEFLGKAKHRFSHIEWDMDVYAASGVVEGFDYVPLNELKKRCSLPTAFAKLLPLLENR